MEDSCLKPCGSSSFLFPYLSSMWKMRKPIGSIPCLHDFWERGRNIPAERLMRFFVSRHFWNTNEEVIDNKWSAYCQEARCLSDPWPQMAFTAMSAYIPASPEIRVEGGRIIATHASMEWKHIVYAVAISTYRAQAKYRIMGISVAHDPQLQALLVSFLGFGAVHCWKQNAGSDLLW